MRPAPPAGWRALALASSCWRSRAMLTAALPAQLAGHGEGDGQPGLPPLEDLAAAARRCAKGGPP
eukprot:4115653-Lingulodinium_polyedra.AAC.1